MKFYRLSGATFYDCIITIYQFIKPFLNNKMSTFEEYGAFKILMNREGAYITKTCLYKFDPLKPHLYIVKLGFPRVYIIFLISAQNHRLWALVRTASARRF